MVFLRPILPEDREQMLDILTSDRVNRTYMLPDYENREDAIPLFLRLMELSNNETRFVRCISLDGKAIGFMNDVVIQGKIIELGYVIHPDYQNRGFMTAALKAAIAELAELGYRELITGAFSENTPSIRVMEKCGMVRQETTEEIPYRGQTHHCIYYSLPLGTL